MLLAQERKEKITAVLDIFPNLAILCLVDEKLVHFLPVSVKRLALAMLLIMRPRLLLLDEPSAGLSPKVVETILSTVRDLTRIWGITVLLVEQNIQQALSNRQPSHRIS